MLKHVSMWECLCDCGKECTVRGNELKKGGSKSCGCLKRLGKHGHASRMTPTYRSWLAMRSRCLCKNHTHFKHYGGRGIKIYEGWNDFNGFLSDMGEKPTSKHTIDRINNDGDYEPLNCEWKNRKEQSNNRRTCRKIEFDGRAMTISQWADYLNISYETLIRRIRSRPIQRAMTEPIDKSHSTRKRA